MDRLQNVRIYGEANPVNTYSKTGQVRKVSGQNKIKNLDQTQSL